jgi:hypothetical protein
MANATLSTSRCHGYVGPVYIQLLASCALIIFLSRQRLLAARCFCTTKQHTIRSLQRILDAMALPPGTTVLSKGARKFYEDAGPSFELFNQNDTPGIPLTFNQTDSNGNSLPAPVDPRGQVPITWTLNPVAHTSRSRVRQCHSTLEAPSQVRAPTRNIPTSRVGFTYGRVPSASTGALSRASAQAHAVTHHFGSPPHLAQGRSALQSLPPQGYVPQLQPQQLHHWYSTHSTQVNSLHCTLPLHNNRYSLPPHSTNRHLW